MTRRLVILLAIAAAIAGLVASVTWAYERWRGAIEEDAYSAGRAIGKAEVQALRDEDRARAQEAAIDQAHRAAAETLRRLEKQQENQRAQDDLVARMRLDNDRLAAAADRLQLRASAYLDAAGCGQLSGDSAVACIRQAAGQIVDVLGRCAQRHRELAAVADDARARGLKCEADYDALELKFSPLTQ
jgi:hypothetical protein